MITCSLPSPKGPYFGTFQNKVNGTGGGGVGGWWACGVVGGVGKACQS